MLQALVDDPGVTHITADRGGATEPPGDLVTCGITLTELETVISAAADRAQAQVVTPEIDTIVWEEVSIRTNDESTLIVNLLGLLAGGLAALVLTRVWARRIEAGRVRFRPKSARGSERSFAFA